MKLKEKKRNFKNFANYSLQLSTAFFIFALCSIIYPQSVNAQEFNMNGMPPPDMHMEYTAGALSDGGTLAIFVTVPDKWHVNANVVTDEFLKPSSIEAKADGIEFGDVVWPEPIKEYNEALELEILTFRGTFKIEIPAKAAGKDYDSL
jgi:thiol:disulfide interchange protein DsbD